MPNVAYCDLRLRAIRCPGRIRHLANCAGTMSSILRPRAAETKQEARGMNYKGEQKALDPIPPQAIPRYLQETYW